MLQPHGKADEPRRDARSRQLPVCELAVRGGCLLYTSLAGHTWIYRDSPVMHIDEQEALRFDSQLAPMEKKHMPSQEEFYILSHAVLP